MSIVVSVSDAFAIESYDGLIAYIEEVLDRDDLTDQIPNFIHLASLRLDRVLLPPARQGSASIAVTADTATASLPTDFKQLIAANIAGTPIEQVSTAMLYEGWNNAVSGEPRVFSIGNGTLRLAPTPDAAYTITIDYLKGIVPLSAADPTNWVLESHADLYVYGALLQAEAYLSNDDRLAIWKTAFDEAIGEVNAQGLRYRSSGSPLRLRSPVCV